MGGAVEIRKPSGEDVRLQGTVNTVRGFYEFQGRRFEVSRDGTIRFDGLSELNPALDLTAMRVISGIETRVRITGRLREPQLQLSSNPPLDQADILSLIAFNQPVNQLGEGQRVSLAQRAAQLAGGFVVSPIVESIGDALQVDLFEVEGPTDAGNSASVTVGEQVGERLFVKFRQQFGAEDVSEFILEYQLAEYLRLQTSIAERSGAIRGSLTRRVERGGLDLIFFFSY
jgi:translocation and assembly module TamB